MLMKIEHLHDLVCVVVVLAIVLLVIVVARIKQNFINNRSCKHYSILLRTMDNSWFFLVMFGKKSFERIEKQQSLEKNTELSEYL